MRATLTLEIHDSALEKPATGVRFQVYWVEPHGDVLLRAGVSNAAGSTDTPLLEASKFSAGTYKLVLHVGDYLTAHPAHLDRPWFDLVHAVFLVADAGLQTRVRVDLSLTQYTVTCS